MVTLREPRRVDYATMNSGGAGSSSQATGSTNGKSTSSSGRRARRSSSPSASTSASAIMYSDPKRTLRSANVKATKASDTSSSPHATTSTRRRSARIDDTEAAAQPKRARRVNTGSGGTEASALDDTSTYPQSSTSAPRRRQSPRLDNSGQGDLSSSLPPPFLALLPHSAQGNGEELAVAPAEPGATTLPSRPRRSAQRQKPREELDVIDENEDEADSGASYNSQDDDGDSEAKVRSPKAASGKASSKTKVSAVTHATASTSSVRLAPLTQTATLPQSLYYSPANSMLATAQETAQRTHMLSLLAPLAAPPPRDLAPGEPYHKAVRAYFANLKNSRVYQLSERPANAQSWREVVASRRQARSLASGGLVQIDVLKASKPLAIRQLDPNVDDDRDAIERADTYASVYTREAVSHQRIFGLPFATTFEKAPILGVDEVNITVRGSTGETLLQRFSPTSRKQSMAADRDWRNGGKAAFDALFARQPRVEERDGNLGQVIHCGGWAYPGGKYGWSSDHAQRRPESDDALRWIWRWFHAHVITLACFLERDFQEDLAMRVAGFDRYKRLMGKGKSQTSLAHPWFSLASVTKGYETAESNHGSDKEPSILTTFEEPILLYVAHHEGFFKVVVRPGQVVFLRSHKLHSIQPLTHPRIDKPRYGVSFATHKAIAGLETRSKKGRQRLKDPPQPAPGAKETRVSFAGAGNGRSSKKGTVAGRGGGGGRGRAHGGKKKDGEDDWSSGSSSSSSSSSSDDDDDEQDDAPELEFPCGGRLGWELEQGREGNRTAVAAGAGGVAEEDDDDE